MPKLKTVKSAAKRILKKTKKGQILRLKISAQHLARKKSKRTKRKKLRYAPLGKAERRKIRKMLPYLK